MDILSDDPQLDLYDPDWRVYSVNPNQPPQYIAPEAIVNQSMINEGCMVFGEVHHSVLSYGVHVGAGSIIEDSVIMPNVKIGCNVRIRKAIIGAGSVIGDRCQIGDPTQCQIIVIGEDTTVKDDSIVHCIE
jgi:glucose-1-phosphate adenylyltransferase